MVAVESWRANAATCNDDILVRNHHYKLVVARRLGLSIGAEDTQVLMPEITAASREQVKLSQISSGAALLEPPDAFGATPPAAWFRLPSSFVVSPICTICYLSGTVRDCADGLGGITLQYRFCTLVWWEVPLCFIDINVA